MKLKDEWFKHFRIFLKTNDFYKEFMECFRKQQYRIVHYNLYEDARPNYIKIMRKYYERHIDYEEFGAMIFTFNSFKWAEGGVKVPLSFTKKWCTVGFKWGLYCIEHNIEICSIARFIQLIDYWVKEKWIEYSMITKHENKLFDEIKEKAEQERIKRLNREMI